MMQKQNYNDKINSLKALRQAASPDQQLEIDFTIFGMQWAFGEGTDEELHKKRMELLFSPIESDKKKGAAYRKGMDIVLYSVRGKVKESLTKLPNLYVPEDICTAINNIKKFLNMKTAAPIRKAALRWWIEMMNEKHGRDFFNE